MTEQQLIKDIFEKIKKTHLNNLNTKIKNIRDNSISRFGSTENSVFINSCNIAVRQCIDNIFEELLKDLRKDYPHILQNMTNRAYISPSLVDELFIDIRTIRDIGNPPKIIEYKNTVTENIQREFRIIDNS